MRGNTNHKRWLLCVLFVLAAKQTAFAHVPPPDSLDQATIIYVDDDAKGLNVGTSWEHAVNSLQDALLLAYFSDKPVEIRIAEGVYTPDRGLGIMPGDSSASFQLINGVTIKGGYAPNMGGHGFYVRDTNQYKSILSGDLNANDGPALTTIEENSFHVITSSENDATAVLDGFTISGSSFVSDRNPNNHSSGMYTYKSSPTLIDCNFTGNMAAERGAGMYNAISNPVLLNCTFNGNNAPEGGAGIYNVNSNPMLTNCTFSWNIVGGRGAGMYNVNSNPALLNCVFTSNSAGMSGGGMYNEKSAPTLTDCTFTYNSAQGEGGGGIYNEQSISVLADCAFQGNATEGSGGGMYNNSSSKATLLSCVFNDNSAKRSGGGLYNNIASETSLTNCILSSNNTRDGGGGLENLGDMTLFNCTFSKNLTQNAGGAISNIQDGRMTLVNCILWDDIPDEIYAVSGSIRHGRTTAGVGVTYSDVQNGWPGDGNIDVGPLFADPERGDFHLKSHGGRWDPISQSWLIDDISSPCIDAGSPYEPVGLERFPNGDRINMGAYGGTQEASLSPRLLPRLPGQASNPSPANGAVDVGINVTISWAVGVDAVTHNVYFGSDVEELMHVSIQQTTNEMQLMALHHEVTYYWRIDEVNSDGRTITGEIWTFTTTSRPKGRTCFTAETKVWAGGAPVPISKIALGQNICNVNGLSEIQEIQEHNGNFTCYDVLLESGNCLSVAENHYFLAESRQWISLQDLKAGAKLQTPKGPIGITSITKRPAPYIGKVYNLNVADSDRYLVGKDAVIVRDY